MRKSSYEDQISDAIRKSKRVYKNPAERFAAVLYALGEDISVTQLNAEWREFYANESTPKQKL